MSVLEDGQLHTPRAGALRARGQRLSRRVKRDLKKQFFHDFVRSTNVSQSCGHIGISRNTFYGWLQRDTAFKEKYDSLCALIWPEYDPPAAIADDTDAEDDPWRHSSDAMLALTLRRLEKWPKW